MYQYTELDQKIVEERVNQFRDQTQRYLAGHISDTDFLPLRLQNGLYIQRHAPMLRVAIPYGLLNSKQVRMLAHIARKYDKGYGHISTRQNIQYNWPALAQVPDILQDLASVQMHAIQTSGNCIRNITTDQFAGVAADEVADPRSYCEIIRQWSTFHPEFAYLPRKFKIAVSADQQDRAAILFHDIGVKLKVNEAGEHCFDVYAGGGLGRTPVIGTLLVEQLQKTQLIAYLEAILQVYNRYGRRDNKYKARIKILVRAMGAEAFKAKVDEAFAHLKDSPLAVPEQEFSRVAFDFTPPAYQSYDDASCTQINKDNEAYAKDYPSFGNWLKQNVQAHKKAGFGVVTLSLKALGNAPGDISEQQLDALADLADQFSFGQVRTTHFQNVVLADVKQADLFQLWQQLVPLGFATANIGTLSDIICCPGGDFCSLANAKSIPVAEEIQSRFEDLDYLYDLGPLELNISGCMNACGHHHIGHIGILGVDRKGEEYYQVSVGGSGHEDASIAKIIGPSISRAEVADVVERLIQVYVDQRTPEETFLDTVRRLGVAPFKERAYAKTH